MTKLQPIQLDDDTVIYIEADDNAQAPLSSPASSGEQQPMAKGGNSRSGAMSAALTQFQSMQNTIRGYTTQSLNAFRNLAGANVDKVTLEFGIRVGGEAGIPYVTKGSADSNIKITVECSFPKEE
ncbi:MAG: CU044_2847 family protein [Candidatus Electrothrix sp. YB6]